MDKRDDKPKPDVNATIQLDQVDADQIAFPDSEPARRVTPPPLPPEELLRVSKAPVAPTTSQPPPARPSAAPPPRSMGKTIGLVTVFVVLIGLAIFGGLHVGGLARTAPSASVSVAAAPTPTPTPTPTPSPTPSATASVSGHVEITIPTIEMR